MIRLGIDTGGTYTDAVVIDTDSLEVLAKAKALTTRMATGLKEKCHTPTSSLVATSQTERPRR